MANPTSVDSSLWWDPFSTLLTELENAPLSSDLPTNLGNKLKQNHEWFVETLTGFKKPNEKSREALNSQQVKIGSHTLTIRLDLKEKALQFSSYSCLDEVQSYILVARSTEQKNTALDCIVQEFLHVVLLEYYIERQCLLKCTRRMLLQALYVGNGSKEGDMSKMAQKLINDGLESKLILVLQNLLTCSHPELLDVDLFALWAEETLTEDNLVLDLLFLAYYESFCTCSSERWKTLCSFYKGISSGTYNFGMLAVSIQAMHYSYQAKVRLLLILIETLDLESILQMVHDATPFRQGASVFSVTDILDMDVLVSSFDVFEMKEGGPLILAWAVFLCLTLSLPGKEENKALMEVDHVGYVRQAFKVASLNYFLDILISDPLKDSDGPIAGYRSVLRTFVSAFIASYEINIQLEDSTFILILDILCNIYRGEESLCIQFWDKESIIDGPIRCLLCNLEGEFPFRTIELVRFLSSLSEGTWPAECTYNFLQKSVGISSLFEINSGTVVDNISQIVETHLPQNVPGIEGLHIPSKTRGHILRVVGGNTALVRWEYRQSGVLVLLMHLAQELYLNRTEEVFLTFDLLNRLVSFNKAVSFALMGITNLLTVQAPGMDGHVEKHLWVIEVICTLIRNLTLNSINAAVMSLGVSILSKLLKCFPSDVAAVTIKANILDVIPKTMHGHVGFDDLSRASWLLSGKLTKMLLIDCEQNDNDFPLTVSVLDFTMQLVETGLQNDAVVALVVFCLQYVLVNHEFWKYKAKHTRWKVTVKVLDLMKRCVLSNSHAVKLGNIVWDMLLSDSSIHNTLFRVVCTTGQSLEELYVNRIFEVAEIEGLEHAICYVLDIYFIMISKFAKDLSSGPHLLHQALLSSTTKPIPFAAAVVTLISYFRNQAIQIGAARVLSMLLMISDSLQPSLSQNACISLNNEQISDLKHSVDCILSKEPLWNEDLFVAVVNLLSSAALFQPALLVAMFVAKENSDVNPRELGGVRPPTNETSLGLQRRERSSMIDTLLSYLERPQDYINSNPRLLLTVLNLLKALWQSAGQYINIIERMKSSGKFWEYMSKFLPLIAAEEELEHEDPHEMNNMNLAYKYQCLSAILGIMSYDIFLQKKLLAESAVKQKTGSEESAVIPPSTEKSTAALVSDPKDIISSFMASSHLEDLIKSLTSCKFENGICFRAKVAVSLFTVHVMEKLATGNSGSLSISLIEKIQATPTKLISHPSFLELSAQYLQRGYSGGKELNNLILCDLYYHLQGELEGREIGSGPFRELSQYLGESKLFNSHQYKFNDDLFATPEVAYLFDLPRIRADLGMDLWDYSDWKESKPIAEKMFCCMQDVNSMMLLTSSKLTALKALRTVIILQEYYSVEENTTTGGKIPAQLFLSCIEHVCGHVQITVESLAFDFGSSQYILDFLAAQSELLLHLTRSVHKRMPLSICALVLKTSGCCLKQLSDSRMTVAAINEMMKFFLMLVLSTLEYCSLKPQLDGAKDGESVEDFAQVSNLSVVLLPILCSCICSSEHWTLALTAVDLILRSFLTPKTWFPVIQNHLQLHLLVLKLQDRNNFISVPILMKFFLTIALVRGGADMLISSGFWSSLRMLFSQFWDDSPIIEITSHQNPSNLSERTGNMQEIWGLGVAVVTSIVHSLGHSSHLDVLDNMTTYFFSQKAHMISYYLSVPDCPSDDHGKKRPRAQRTQVSLNALKETEQTLTLMCVLAGHWKSWAKATKETESFMREKCIHFLAFISRGYHRSGESSSRTAPHFCSPILKEEFDSCREPSFIHSKSGWFALSPFSCVSKTKFFSLSTSLMNKAQKTENSDPISQSYFSDSVAVHMYRIAYLLLKFLCLQADGAARRAEDVGYVDLANFPELPMPEILHGLQAQAIAIIIELCEKNKPNQIEPMIQSFCHLLLQVTEMSLYLELCVLQICGIRTVLGHVEDFSKEVKLLLKAVEGHAFSKAPVKSLKKIMSFVYPGML